MPRPVVSRRRAAALGVTALVASASWAVALMPGRASAAGGPSITASPADKLADGQFVKLTFSGFAPSSGIAFRQCEQGATTEATQCTGPNQQVTGVTDPTGGGTTYLPVYAGTDVLLENEGRTGTITCDQDHPCEIAGYPPGATLATAVLAPIAFGPSPDACPPAGANSVLGGGSSSAYRAVYQWESTVCVPPNNLSVGYATSNSVDGVTNFLGGLTQFGVTGPFPEPGPPQGSQTFKYAPLTSSAVVLGYRMYDRRGPQITTLVLTPDLIAQIFLGQVTNWNVNAAINALNPGIEFPSREVTFARAEHSAQTYEFTSWLAAAAPTTWKSGASEIFPLPPSGVVGVTGTTGLKVVDPTTDFVDQGNVGFMDSSTAAFYGLPTAQIKMPDGSVVAATSDAIDKALAAATANSDGTFTPSYATPPAGAYPMPMLTYMMAPTNTVTPEQGSVVAAFLRYGVQAGQANVPPGYAPLPANLVNLALEVASAIPAVVPTPAPTPTPTPVPTLPPVVHTLLPKLSLPPLPSSTPAPSCPAAAVAPPAPTSSSPAAAPTTTATPAPSATACAAAAPPAKHHRRGPPTPSAQQRAEITGLVRSGDASAARYLLPSIASLALLGLLVGPALEVLGRRRGLQAV